MVTLAVPAWLGGSVHAGITYAGPADGGASPVPITTVLPVQPIDEAAATNGAAPAPADPNEVLGGIVSDGSQKQGETAILNDIAKARFIGTLNDPAPAPAPAKPVAHLVRWIGLGFLGACLGVGLLMYRRIKAQLVLGALPPPPTAPARQSEPAPSTELDQPRLI